MPSPAAPLTLHDALPISGTGLQQIADKSLFKVGCTAFFHQLGGHITVEHHPRMHHRHAVAALSFVHEVGRKKDSEDRKSTRLNSSHVAISYAVFCLKKKR